MLLFGALLLFDFTLASFFDLLSHVIVFLDFVDRSIVLLRFALTGRRFTGGSRNTLAFRGGVTSASGSGLFLLLLIFECAINDGVLDHLNHAGEVVDEGEEG